MTIIVSRDQVVDRQRINKWKNEDEQSMQKNESVKWGYTGDCTTGVYYGNKEECEKYIPSAIVEA